MCGCERATCYGCPCGCSHAAMNEKKFTDSTAREKAQFIKYVQMMKRKAWKYGGELEEHQEGYTLKFTRKRKGRDWNFTWTLLAPLDCGDHKHNLMFLTDKSLSR